MDFNPQGDRYSKELVDSSFERECRYLKQLSKYSWAPEVLYTVKGCRQIYFKWYGNTCETNLCDSYKEQLEQIASDLHAEEIYKPSFYPKFFYVDSQGAMRAYAFYSASSYSEQPIDMKFYEAILNPERKKLVNTLQKDNKLDMGILVKHAFTDYIKWPGEVLPEIYKKIYS
jgi:hypothetical protein